MKLAPYPKYKPSGVEWLGNVPEGWNIRQLKYTASINDETLPETTDPAFEMSYVDIGSVDAIEGIVGVEEMTFESAPSRARRIVRDGDTIVSTVRTYLKAIAYIREPKSNTVVSTGFAVIRPRTTNPAFLSYAMRETGFVETIVARSVGVSYPAVNASEIGSLEIPLPSHEEQRAIADFLDCQTAKLDTLIRKKQTLIERLQEKRAALITRTVTRGLPPEAARAAGLEPEPQMKASGVEWLGEVPAHWEVKRLKDYGTLFSGTGFPDQYQGVSGEALPFYKVSDLVRSSDNRYMGLSRHTVSLETTVQLRARVIPIGAIIYAKIGAALYLNRRRISTTECCIDNNMTAYVPTPEYLLPEWAFYWTSIIDFGEFANPGAIPSLGERYQATLLLVLPTLREQKIITNFLDCETAKIDGLIAKVETAIARLREYRGALITAAVTGQVDVRGNDDHES